MPVSTLLTQEKLKEILHYEPETGLWTWLVSNSNRVKIGSIAGNYNKVIKYHQIRIFGKLYYGHILAWLYMTGVWPENEIDHKDTNPSNNKWLNLREATSSQQKWNAGKRKNNTSGYKGVHLDKNSGKYVAQIGLNYKVIYIGSRNTIEEAHQLYCQEIEKYHCEFRRT